MTATYIQEFETVDLLLNSGTRTSGVDAFALSLIKAERQMRKLVTHLVYQFPCFGASDVPNLRKTLYENRRVYFGGFENGFDALYSIGVFGTKATTMEERLGPELLAKISKVTGASAYALDNPAFLPRITEHIALELRNQYIIGYSPENVRHDGKWRKIKVSLVLPRGLPTLHVQARTGYYGPTE